MRIILRDFNRIESDDFKIRVQDSLGTTSEAVELRDNDGKLIGWKIVAKYE